MGLGGFPLRSLSEAREMAAKYRKIARDGGDPLAVRRAQKDIPTFSEAALGVHQANKDSWKNGKHIKQWINTLEEYVNPIIGDLRVDHIETSDVLKVLSPIWLGHA